MHCSITRADNARIHTRLDVQPVRYSHAALGGPDTAELVVSGDKNALSDVLTWLACRVVIYNDAGLPVWWGLVQAAAVTLDGVEYALDASRIVNRMAVVYSDTLGNSAITSWVEDAHSVALYGRRESHMSVKAESNAPALAQATRIVNERSAPMRSVRAAAGADGAILSCLGYWRTLDWRYWSQPDGKVERDEDANATELLGWSLTSAEVGFHRGLMRVGTLGAALYELAETDRVIASGSAGNDGPYEIVDGDTRTDVTTYTSDEIYFDPSDDVHDGDGILNMFLPGDLIEISGATEAGNNGVFFLKDYFQNDDGGYDHMRVYPGSIVNELAGATVTIAAGNSIEVAPRPFETEMPGASVTLASQATKIAMTVTLGVVAAWELSEIWIQAARIGSPADSLKIEICDNSGGTPGTVLKSATVSGGTLPTLENIDWVKWAFDHALLLAAGTYHVVISRTGSPAVDAYRIGIREAAGYFSSVDPLLLYDGSSWIERNVISDLDAALALRVYGERLTTTQVLDIVAGSGDWLTGTRIGTASGLRTHMYRSAEAAQTAQSEIKALLEFGTSGGDRLMATVSVDGALLVDAAPSASAPRYIWTGDGLRDRWGLPLAQGALPVGEWVGFEMASLAETFGASFLEAAEFDVASGTVRPSFRAEQAVSTLARLAQPAALPDLAVRLRPYLR